MGPAHWFGLAILAWAAISVLWSPVMPDALAGMAQLLILSGAFCIGSMAGDLRPFLRATALAFCFCALIVLAARLGYRMPGMPFPLSATLGNPNFAGEAAAPIMVAIGALAIAERRTFDVALASGSGLLLFLSGCRGALLGVAAMGVIWLWPRSRVGATGLALLIVFGLGLTLGRAPQRQAIIERAAIWRDSIDGLRVFGQGIGQYRAMLPRYGHRLATFGLNAEHAHNDLLEIAYELGLPGVLGICGFFLLAFIGPGAAAAKYALGTVLVESLFGFPFHEPVAGFIALVLAGRLCRIGVNLRRDLDERANAAMAGAARLAVSDSLGRVAPSGKSVSARLAGAPRSGGYSDRRG